MPYRSKCVKCKQDQVDRNAVLKWTLFNGSVTVIAPLCFEHGAPLSDLVNIVGPKPPAPQTAAIPRVPLRVPKATPLDWTPPEG